MRKSSFARYMSLQRCRQIMYRSNCSLSDGGSCKIASSSSRSTGVSALLSGTKIWRSRCGSTKWACQRTLGSPIVRIIHRDICTAKVDLPTYSQPIMMIRTCNSWLVRRCLLAGQSGAGDALGPNPPDCAGAQ